MDHIKQWENGILLAKCQELSTQARQACKMLSNNQEKHNIASRDANNAAAVQSDDDDDDSDGIEDEKAYTLAVIVNTDYQYNEVADLWRSNAEATQMMCQN